MGNQCQCTIFLSLANILSLHLSQKMFLSKLKFVLFHDPKPYSNTQVADWHKEKEYILERDVSLMHDISVTDAASPYYSTIFSVEMICCIFVSSYYVGRQVWEWNWLVLASTLMVTLNTDSRECATVVGSTWELLSFTKITGEGPLDWWNLSWSCKGSISIEHDIAFLLLQPQHLL